MKRKLLVWNLIALGVLLVLGTAYWILTANPLEKNSGVVVFIEKEPADIQTLDVTNAAGSYEVSAKDGGYVIGDIPASIVNVEGFYELMYHGSAFGALKRVEANPRDLAKYGLDKPQASVSVAFTSGENFSMQIGAQEVVSGNYYGEVEGDKAVYLFSGEDMAYFLCRKEAYISLQVTPKLAVSSPLSALRDVTFSGAMLEEPLTVQAVTKDNPEVALAAKSFGPATHIVRMKGVYELDQTYGIETLGSLFDIEALDVVGYNFSDADFTKLGFDNPAMVVDFGIKNGTADVTPMRLSLVALKNGQYLANVKGAPVVYLIDKPAFVDLDYTKLMLRWFLAPLRLDLASLSVLLRRQKRIPMSPAKRTTARSTRLSTARRWTWSSFTVSTGS